MFELIARHALRRTHTHRYAHAFRLIFAAAIGWGGGLEGCGVRGVARGATERERHRCAGVNKLIQTHEAAAAGARYEHI